MAEPTQNPAPPVANYAGGARFDDRKTSGMAIASLVCGLIVCIPISSLMAIIFGIVGITQTKPGMAKGRGMAITGLVLGCLAPVVWIIAFVAVAVVMPKVNAPHDQARFTRALSDIADVKVALAEFEIDNDRFPTTAEGLQALAVKPAVDLPNWKRPYLQRVPLDPWGHPYVYVCPGTNGKDYDVYSNGGANGHRIN